MPLEPREHGRHYAGGESQRRPIVWTCPSCETKQEGRPEGGCTACRAGADGVIPDRPQPVFDPATLPEYLDGPLDLPGGEMVTEGEEGETQPVAAPELPKETEPMKDRTEPQAPPEATVAQAGRVGTPSTTDLLRAAADQRTYAITRKAFADAFAEIKEQVLLNTPGVIIPDEARYSVSIALRYLAEQQIAIGPLDGVVDHEQLIAWADLLHPEPTAPADGEPAAGTSEETL